MSYVGKMASMQVRRTVPGFTLIELVVVVAILVVLAGLVLPRLDIFQLKANKGVAAANMMDISRDIQQFYAQNTSYPNQWDSLVDGSGNLWIPGDPGTTPGLDPQLVGGPPGGSPHKLITTTLGGTLELRSLVRMGITTVEDLTSSLVGSAGPGNCFTTPRTLTASAPVATVNPADDDGKAIINHFYPQQADASTPVVPAGHQIVVFGLGPQNTMIGTALQEVPFYTNTNSTQYYNRMLVCFETCTDGTRARLLGVVGGDADLPSDEIGDYYGR